MCWGSDRGTVSNPRTPGGGEGQRTNAWCWPAAGRTPPQRGTECLGGGGGVLATTHRNFSGSSGSSVAHGTLEISRRALRKEGVQRLRWRSGKHATLCRRPRPTGINAELLVLDSGARTRCAPPAAASAQTNFSTAPAPLLGVWGASGGVPLGPRGVWSRFCYSPPPCWNPNPKRVKLASPGGCSGWEGELGGRRAAADGGAVLVPVGQRRALQRPEGAARGWLGIRATPARPPLSAFPAWVLVSTGP